MAAIKVEGEMLTTSGWESIASANLASSFTRHLIDELDSLKGRSIAVCDLHENVSERHNEADGIHSNLRSE